MDDLVGWLRAQLDDDERIANRTGQPSTSWQNFDMRGELRDDHNRGTVAYCPLPSTRRHVARHDPARVLREVDAKRRLLIVHRPVRRTDFIAADGSPVGTLVVCHECDANTTDPNWPDSPCATLRLLALPYADRPGYRDEWRP